MSVNLEFVFDVLLYASVEMTLIIISTSVEAPVELTLRVTS